MKTEILNSMEYGNVPQNRERIYIVGFKDKKDAEIKAEADKQAEIEAELSASDHQKFMFVIIELEELKVKYSFKSKKYQKLQGNVNELIDKIISFSQEKVG